MKTSIIILTYNKLHYTKLCIESIRQFTKPGTYEIVVIDNNSNDDTVRWLDQQEDIVKIYNEENLGFPKGCNQGMKIATGDNILLLNNDTIVTNNWLENMVQALYSSENIGAVGCVTNNCSYYQAIPVSYQSIEEMHEFAAGFNIANSTQWEERLKLIGFCILIKGAIVKEVGLLDERFTPGNYEDDDYSLRIRQAGYKLLLCKDTFIHHFGSVSFKDNNEAYLQLLKTNEQKFHDKWGFNPTYSSYIRDEVIGLMDNSGEEEINVLEVGCACGGTLLKIKNIYRRANLFGIEMEQGAAQVASLIADVRAEDIEQENLSYPEEHFDYIIFADVLEHLYDPWKVIHTIKKYLKPTGKLLISIPNVMHFSVLKDLVRGRWSYTDAGILDRTHIRFFTLGETIKMLEDAEYGVVNFSMTTLDPSAEEEAFMKVLTNITKPEMRNQYMAYQYLIKAQKNKSVIDLLAGIKKEENLEENLESLAKVDFDRIIEAVLSFPGDKIEMLHLLAIVNFQYGLLDNVLPYLSKALELDEKNDATLYNLAFVLNAVNETSLALEYMEQISHKDEVAAALYEEIVNKERLLEEKHHKEIDLKFLLRRFENQISDKVDEDKLVTYIGDETINTDDIIEIVYTSLIDKVAIFNLLAITSFQNRFLERIIPFLQAAYQLDNSHKDTLYNLGFVLIEFGEPDMALGYLDQIVEQDDEVLALIATAKGELHHE